MELLRRLYHSTNSKITDANTDTAVFFSQADLNCNVLEETGAFYGVTSQYESPENMTITCSTKVCSFGKQVVEKVEVGFYTPCTCISADQNESYGGI